MGEIRNAYKTLVRKLGGKSAWGINIRTDLREKGWEDVNWTLMVQDRDQLRGLANMVMNLWFP
jgi:hypothetical protein